MTAWGPKSGRWPTSSAGMALPWMLSEAVTARTMRAGHFLLGEDVAWGVLRVGVPCFVRGVDLCIGRSSFILLRLVYVKRTMHDA